MTVRAIRTLDARLLRTVQMLPSGVRPAMELASLVGQPVAVGSMLAVVAAAYGLAGNYDPAGACLAAIGSIVFTNVLKLLFRRTRPDTYVPLVWHSYSFPSGHAAACFIGFGLMAWLGLESLSQPWSLVLSGLLAALTGMVGISRVYLGAHYPTDVLGGWAVGLLVLAGLVPFFGLPL